MDSEEFRRRGKEMIDFIADYMDNINDRRVTPDIEPGYLKSLMSLEPPQNAEPWEEIFKDVESKIMPGITHWQHPKFHAYFPAGNSYPSILGDLLSSGLGINGFSWASSPACTELETIVMHWLGNMSGLDKSLLPYHEDDPIEAAIFDDNMNTPSLCENHNLNRDNSFRSDSTLNKKISHLEHHNSENLVRAKKHVHTGGGVLLGSASECVLVSMLAARCKAISKYKRKYGPEEDGIILTKLVAYTSKLAHSCVEKAAMISLVKIRLLDVDEDLSLRGQVLKKAIEDDLEQGLIPFYACGTLGTTGCCSYDNLEELGPLCEKYEVYLHADAAYAGNALICEEFRPLMAGIHLVDSFSYNPNKWMLVNFDSSCLWVKDKYTLTKALSIDPVYLQYRQMEKAIDYRNWGISLSRRFRALKLWFTIRNFGVNGLKSYIRNHVNLAKEFEKMVLSDNRFTLFGKVTLGLVCFHLRNDTLSKNLLLLLNDSGRIHMTPAIINDRYVIRFCVNAKDIKLEDIRSAWEMIKSAADQVFDECRTPLKISTPRFELSGSSENLNSCKLKRKTFSRMVSEPVKFRSLNSLSIKSFNFLFEKTKPMRKIVSEDVDETL